MLKEIKLTFNLIHELLSGKKLSQIFINEKGEKEEITIIPPRYGVFLTLEEIQKVREYKDGYEAYQKLIKKLDKEQNKKIKEETWESK